MNRIVTRATLTVVLLASITVYDPMEMLAATGKVKTKETHQTMEGFGASIAWADGQLTGHPKKSEIYNYIFPNWTTSSIRYATYERFCIKTIDLSIYISDKPHSFNYCNNM